MHPNTDRSLKPWFNIFFYLVVAAALVLAAFMPLKNYGVFDDAYMFIRYAYNMAHGGTYGWNLHDKTYGCTSIPYTFFIFVLEMLGLGRLTTPSHLIVFSSFIWGIAALILFYHTLKLLTRNNKWFDTPILKCIVLLVILMPIFLPHFYSGMDTMISLFSNTLLIFAFLSWHRSPTTRGLILAAMAAYFTFLVRPDNLIYAILFPFLFLVGYKRSPREIILACAVIGSLLVLDTLVKWAYFGNPLPLPFYAKTSGFYTGYIGISRWNNMEYLTTFALSYGALPLVFYLLVYSRASLRQVAIYVLPLILTLGYLTTVVQIMGSEARYYIPSIPFLICGLLQGLVLSLPDQPPFPLRKLLIGLTVTAGLLFSSNYLPSFYMAWKIKKAQAQASAIPKDYPSPLTASVPYNDQWLKARNDLNSFLQRYPGKIKIAASEYGYIGACNPDIPILDLCGLHNKAMATAGYNDSDLVKFSPDLVWMVHNEYTGLYHQIVKGPYFQEAYEFHPDLMLFGLAIKKSSPYYNAIEEEFVNSALSTHLKNFSSQ
jgi:hypothetical protein